MKKTVYDFKIYVRKEVDKIYSITPSAVVLKSFYIMDVDKPKEVTIKTFFWLRAIAEQEIKSYKSTNHATN